MELRWARLEGRDGHTVGRELLADMVGQQEIMLTDAGKPYFPHSPLHFSISHTKDHVFVCVSEKNVGIDAEEIGRKIRPSLMRILSAGEGARVKNEDDFLKLWVLKEAFAKLTGQGMGNYLKNTDFYPDDGRIREIDGCFVAVMEE